MSEPKRFIDVAAGLILTPDGKLLLAQRPDDKAWCGWWELPGGKLEPGETAEQALVRELNEELGIEVTQTTPWVTYTHEYPKTIVRLAFHRVTGWNGEPSGIEGQAIAWTQVHGKPSVSPLLPATEPPLRWLQLPDRYLLTSIATPDRLQPFLEKLSAALQAGVKLVQFREPAWAQRTDNRGQDALYAAFQSVLALCRQHNAYCIVNSVHPAQWGEQADGIHYRAADAAALAGQPLDHSTDPASHGNNPVSDDSISAPETKRDGISTTVDIISDASTRPVNMASEATGALPGALRGTHYVGMSAHTAHDLDIARQIRADFAVLGHVLDTPSHPGVPGMGWQQFSELNQQAGLPVLAIGGQTPQTAGDATRVGAHGIAGMRLIDGY